MTNLRREIFEQPDVLATLLEREGAHAEALVRAWQKRGVKYVLVAARGSSDNAATYGKYLFGVNNALPVASAAPSSPHAVRQAPGPHRRARESQSPSRASHPTSCRS